MKLLWRLQKRSSPFCREPSLLARAEAVHAVAAALTAEPLPPPRALAQGNAHLNAALLAALFRARPALDSAAAAVQQRQLAAWLEEYSMEVSTLLVPSRGRAALSAQVCMALGGYDPWSAEGLWAAWLEEYALECALPYCSLPYFSQRAAADINIRRCFPHGNCFAVDTYWHTYVECMPSPCSVFLPLSHRMPELTGRLRAAQDSREERTFRVWLQSLLRDQVALGSLAEGLRDGARPRSASMPCGPCLRPAYIG